MAHFIHTKKTETIIKENEIDDNVVQLIYTTVTSSIKKNFR